MTSPSVSTELASSSMASRCHRTPIALAVGLALAASVPLVPAVAAPPKPGAALGHNFQVNTFSLGDQGDPSVARDAAGDFVVVWDDNRGSSTASGVFAQRYAADGTPEGSEFQVNAPTSGFGNVPQVAMDADGDFVVVWTLYKDGASYDGGSAIFARRYDAQGNPLPIGGVTSAYLVSPHVSDAQGGATVAMDAEGDFVVAWQRGVYGTTNGYGIFARRFDKNGSATSTSATRVNTVTTGDQEWPAVAMDAAGDFVVAWGDKGGVASNGYGIAARRFDPSGSSLKIDGVTADQIVNTQMTGDQVSPTVAMDAAGDFVIAWTDKNGGSSDVFARRFDNSGAALKIDGITSDARRVNTYTTGDQRGPSAAMDAVGDFVVTWQDDSSHDGNKYGTFMRRYDSAADHWQDTSDVQVNTHTSGSQYSPRVAMDASGDFVIAWTDDSGYDGSKYSGWFGVFAQRYTRQSPVDIKAALTASPSVVQAGHSFTLTAALTNNAPYSTVASVAGNAMLKPAVNNATGLSVTIPLPAGVTLNSSTGTGDWACSFVKAASSKITCDYAGSLAPQSATPNVVVNLTAPSTARELDFQYTVYGDQPDAKTSNNTAKATVTVQASSSGGVGGSSSGGGGGAFGWLGLGLLGLPWVRRRRKR